MTPYLFKHTRLIIALGDSIILSLMFLAGFSMRRIGWDPYSGYNAISVLLVTNTCVVIASIIQRNNTFYRISSKMRLFRGSIFFVLFHFLLVHTLLGITHTTIDAEWIVFHVYLPALFAIPLWRYFIKIVLEKKREEGHNLKKVIIIGSDPEALRLGEVFDAHPEYGYRFDGYFTDDVRAGRWRKGSIADAFEFVNENRIDEIYCAISAVTNEQADSLMQFAEDNFKRIHFIPVIKPEEQLQRYKIEYFDNQPVMVMPHSPLDIATNRFVKRVFDIVVSLLVIVLFLSWMIPLISLFILIDSKGPVFYRQKRSGLNNKVFWCLKFRSMYVDKKEEFKQATRNDPRVTAVGAFLRKTSLDELPQFFCVLFGEMSIIGPRPHPIELDSQYINCLTRYKKRLSVKPGITGLSQVRGYRGETNEAYLMKNRVTMDIFYSENWSLLFDIKIVLLTIVYAINGNLKAY